MTALPDQRTAALGARLRNLRRLLLDSGQQALLVTDPLNVRYLSGFTGSSAALLITNEQSILLTDSRYSQQAAGEAPHFRISRIAAGQSYDELIALETAALAVSTLAFEAAHMTVARHEDLCAKLQGVRPVPVRGLVSGLRMIKDELELTAIRRACALVDHAFQQILTAIRPGLSEQEVALELELLLRKSGSGPLPFEMIVASGARSSLPHGRATEKIIERGDFVTLDFGATVDGYASDITRTVVAGAASDRQREIYSIVSRALQAGKDAIRPGAAGRDVDETARSIIRDAGFGSNFGHGLGHGLGLHVHDHPGLSSRSEITLEAGMVLTVEPGIYVDGWGGVRIEDDVLVTPDGAEVLTHANRELIEFQ